MLDIKYIKENPEDVIERLARKGKDAREDIARILELDGQRRAMIADDIYTLYRLGVLSGSDSKRSFLPDSNIKRSEVAAILCRLGGTGRVEF